MEASVPVAPEKRSLSHWLATTKSGVDGPGTMDSCDASGAPDPGAAGPTEKAAVPRGGTLHAHNQLLESEAVGALRTDAWKLRTLSRPAASTMEPPSPTMPTSEGRVSQSRRGRRLAGTARPLASVTCRLRPDGTGMDTTCAVDQASECVSTQVTARMRSPAAREPDGRGARGRG